MGQDNSKGKKKDPFAIVLKSKKYKFLSDESITPGKKELKLLETHFDGVKLTNPENDFELVKKVGKGSFGTVHKVKEKNIEGEKTRYFASKIISMTNETPYNCKQILKEVKREIDILRDLDHPNIMKFYGFYYFKTKWWILIEYCHLCIVDCVEYFPTGLSEKEIGAVVKQLLKAMSFLYKGNKIHRDIKAANILLKKNGAVKLADFGVAAQLSDRGERRKSFEGSPCWMAPEVIKYAMYGRKADVWSLGITIIELAERFPPYYRLPQNEIFHNIQFQQSPDLKEKKKWSKKMREFLGECLNKSESTRYTPGRLLDHPWMMTIKNEKKTVKKLVKRVLQAYKEAGGREKFIENYEKNRILQSGPPEPAEAHESSNSDSDSDYESV